MKTSLFILSLALVLSIGVFSPGVAQAALGDQCDTSANCVVLPTTPPSNNHPGTYSCIGGNPASTALEGRCSGPCDKTTTTCQTAVGAPLGWAASACTAANDQTTATAGVCAELPAGQLSTGPQSGSQLLATVDTLTNWVFAVFVVLAILFVLLAAFQFVTAGGEATKLGEARSKLIWAVVGIVIALLAKGIVPVVRSITGS